MPLAGFGAEPQKKLRVKGATPPLRGEGAAPPEKTPTLKFHNAEKALVNPAAHGVS